MFKMEEVLNLWENNRWNNNLWTTRNNLERGGMQDSEDMGSKIQVLDII